MFFRTAIKDYYAELEVKPNASLEEIKRAYRKLAMLFHPDKAAQNGLTNDEATEKFKTLNEAYSVLSDKNRRVFYDANFGPVQSAFEKFKASYKNKNSNYAEIIYPDNLNKELQALLNSDDTHKFQIYLNGTEHKPSLLKNFLFWACFRGKFNIAKYLIEVKNISPNLQANYGLSFTGGIFKAAAQSGNLELVRYLLEGSSTHANFHGENFVLVTQSRNYCIDIESQGLTPGTQDTALSRAAEEGHVAVVEYLIAKGANVNPNVSYSNLLRDGIKSRNPMVVERLIKSGTIIDPFDLMFAFEKGNIDTVKIILLEQPDINAHRYFETAACAAISSGNPELVKYLEEQEGLNIFEPCQHYDDINYCLLREAGKSKSIEMMRYLLEKKGLLDIITNLQITDIKKYNSYIHTALYFSLKDDLKIRAITINEQLNLLRFLIEEKKFLLPEAEYLHFIQEGGRFACIELNAYLQSNLAHSDEDKKLLLTLAHDGLTKLSLPQLFRLYNSNILKQGEYDYQNQIYSHIQKRDIEDDELVKLDSQAMTNALFFYADYHFDKDFSKLEVLVNSGANINAINYLKNNLVLHASRGGFNNIVKFLLKNGADFHYKNVRGESLFSNYNYLKEFHVFISSLEKSKLDVTKNSSVNSETKQADPSQKCVLKSELPKFIQMADKPLAQGGVIENVTPSQLEKCLGIVYDESIYLDKKVDLNEIQFSENVTGDIPAATLVKQVKLFLKEPNFNLVVCKMGDLGYGTFAAKFIPKNTILGIYSGKIILEKKVKDPNDNALGYYGSNIAFSTLSGRGLASYMQHLPEKIKFNDAKMFSKMLALIGQTVSETQLKSNIELYSVKFSSESVKENVATENVRREFLNVDGVPVVAMIADVDIPAKTIVGFNYYGFFPCRDIVPELLNKNGEIIPHEDYKRTFGELSFDDFTYTGEYAPLIQAIKDQTASVTVVDDDKKTHVVDSAQLKKLLVKANALSDVSIKPHVTSPADAALTAVRVVDKNRNLLASFEITKRTNHAALIELREMLGHDVIRKIAFQSSYEISQSWLASVSEVNAQGISEVAAIVDMTEKNFKEKLNLQKNTQSHSGSKPKV